MRIGIARGLSILGHPLLVVPAAAGLVAAQADPKRLGPLLLILGLVGAVVLGFSGWRVAQGRWGHMDAIDPRERGSLNRFTAAVLCVAAAGAWLLKLEQAAVGVGSAVLIIAAAAFASRWLKLSQHVAFCTLACAVALPLGPRAVAFGAGLIVLVAWSRLALGRHTGPEVAAGFVTGLAGAAAMMASQRMVG